MKKLFFYVLGALFLFASCQSDELDNDEALVLENDVILMKAIDAYNNYQSKTDWSQASKSPKANQVTKKWTMKYTRGTVNVVPNIDCDPNLLFLIEGDGLGSLFGRFTFIDTACFDPVTGEFLTPLLGVITTAAGDQLYFELVSITPDPPPNENIATLYWIITGGSEGGRFERASGSIYIYGDNTVEEFTSVGWGEITY